MRLLDRGTSTPLHAQLTTILRGKIERGDWQPGEKIASENELSHIYGISRTTARQVLTQLVSGGVLFRVHGKGTFVARRKIAARPLAYMGIREQLERRGYVITTRVCHRSCCQRMQPSQQCCEYGGEPCCTRFGG